ncbi:hypothetical protein DPMN_085615 [Dreissena polymorpha]|uniref:Uncharacterized protein n=1 Tax=Dreissena polymorpha TaxID=45954 RepID=A0A9D3YCP9_DREPO|nr:hypothetical protein DPMN_085615 [Dreissena polymorpha]
MSWVIPYRSVKMNETRKQTPRSKPEQPGPSGTIEALSHVSCNRLVFRWCLRSVNNVLGMDTEKI